jgi:hypothetical protein
MLSHTRARHPSHNLRWESASVTIAVLVALLLLIFLFLFLTLTATPAQGQSHVPPTAVQAAKMPQFASKLAHPLRMRRSDNASGLPGQQRASYRTPTDPRTWYGHGGPLDSVDIYDNGHCDILRESRTFLG